MTNEFVKLNIGESVASGSGRAWKKLAEQLPPPQLSAPTISVAGNILTIIDISGLATSFGILVDAEEMTNVVRSENSGYNGVTLPPLPADVLADYPYAWIRNNDQTGYYDLLLSSSLWYAQDGDTIFTDGYSSGGIQWYRVAKNDTEATWVFNQAWTSSGSFGNESDRQIMWSNHDIPNGSATATDIYFEGTEPAFGTNFELKTLQLEAGNYSITAIAKADGYLDSKASNVVSCELVALSAPTISLNGGILTITGLVENAQQYSIYINGEKRASVADPIYG